MSNYETAKHTAQKLFLSSYQHERIRRFSSGEDETYIYLEFLSTPFRIQKETGLCESLASDGHYEEASFNTAMTLYDLLSFGKGGPLTGDMVSLAGLSTVQNAYSFAGKGMFSRYEELFDQKKDKLSAVCRALNGVPKGKGDVSYLIPVNQEIFLLFSFWDSDEEFPASLQVYADRGILGYMHYETVWYMVAALLSRISSLLSDAKPSR